MTKEERMRYLIAACLAILIAGSAALYKFHFEKPDVLPRTLPPIGKVGSAHAHASLSVFVEDAEIDFCFSQFMLRSQYVHFEDNDCHVVHRHATGVTIPTFFNTIGVELTASCIGLPSGKKYCADNKNILSVVVNGSVIPTGELSYYEFKNNDHILVNYGPETGTALKFKYNSVPAIPLDVNKPETVDDPFGAVVDVKPLENTDVKN